MNIKYLFGDNNNYMNFAIDVTAKTLTGTYVRDSNVIIEETVDVSQVLDVNSKNLPKVELAKRGFIWDFRLSKRGDDGKLVRSTLSILADFLLSPTSVEFSNPTGINRTLKDLTSYPLSAYESPMTVKQKVFNNTDNVTGVSGESTGTVLSPIVTSKGLLIGESAYLSVLLSASPIPVPTNRLFFSLKFSEMPIMASNTRNIEFQVGGNLISIYNTELQLNGHKVCDLHNFLPNNRIIFKENECIIDGVLYPCSWIDSDFSTVIIKGDANTAEFYLEDITVQAIENFFEDSNPPESITQLESIASDSEVFLNWKASEENDIAGYNVYVNGIKDNLTLITTPDYQVTGLVNGIEYLITVTAVDASNNESIPVESLKVRPISDPSKEVSNVSIDSTAAGVRFKFTPPTAHGIDKICIYQQDMANVGLNMVAELTPDTTEFTLSPPPPEGKYMYVITGRYMSGDETLGVQCYHFVNYSL